jgi:hypothetical protein
MTFAAQQRAMVAAAQVENPSEQGVAQTVTALGLTPCSVCGMPAVDGQWCSVDCRSSDSTGCDALQTLVGEVQRIGQEVIATRPSLSAILFPDEKVTA